MPRVLLPQAGQQLPTDLTPDPAGHHPPSTKDHMMTAYPIEENTNCWWLTTRKAWNRLHAIPGDDITQEQHRAAIDYGDPLTRKAACGQTLDLTYPGLHSRFGLPRCAHCCRTLGIPTGNGTPVNEDTTPETSA